MTTIRNLDEIPERKSRTFLVEPDWGGISVAIERGVQGAAVRLEGAAPDAEPPAELARDAMATLPAGTTATGRIELFVGHARQPENLARAVLADKAPAPAGARVVCRLADLVRCENVDTTGQPAEARRAQLVRLARPQGCVSLVPCERMPGSGLDGLGCRRGLRYRVRAADAPDEAYVYIPATADTDQPTGDASAIAVSLGARSVDDLLSALEALRERTASLEAECDRLMHELAAAQARLREAGPLAALGRETYARLVEETLVHLRALATSASDPAPYASQAEAVETGCMAVPEVIDLHAACEQAFQEAFPTRPRSVARPLDETDHRMRPFNAADFRCDR